MTASGVLALARGALIPAMTKIELPDDKPVNLRPKTGEFQGANWALAPMLPQGATSWSLQLTAGADLGSADPRAVDPASRGSLVLADSHASTRMKIVPGGVGLVYAPNDLGYPVGEPVDPDWVSDCDLFAGLCVTDPKRIKRTWTQAGSDMFGTEVGTPVQEELVVFCDTIPGVCNVEILPIRDIASAELLAPMFSVVRTGAGDLGAAAAGDLRMDTPYGFYTAGTPSTALRRADGDPYAQPRGRHIFDPAEGAERASLLGPQQDDYSAANGAYRAWYPERGGNVDIVVGGSVSGDAWTEFAPPADAQRQRRQLAVAARVRPCRPHGGSTSAPMPCPCHQYVASSHPYIVGFTGFGTLGGGNLSIAAGGDAGIVAARGLGDYGAPEPRSRAWSRPWAAPAASRRRQPGADRRRRFEAAAGRRPEPGPGRLAVRHAVPDQSPEARPGRHGDQPARRHPD